MIAIGKNNWKKIGIVLSAMLVVLAVSSGYGKMNSRSTNGVVITNLGMRLEIGCDREGSPNFWHISNDAQMGYIRLGRVWIACGREE
jgi:hypothetical protein